MKTIELFRLLYKSLNAKCIDIKDNYMVFEVEVYGVGSTSLQIREIASEFYVRIFKGVFCGKTFGSKGSKNFIRAKSLMLLSDKIQDFIKNPENFYGKIEPIGKRREKGMKVFTACTVKIKNRKLDVLLDEENYKRLECHIIDPSEKGIPVISKTGNLSFKKYITKMKVRGNANKTAKMSMYNDNLSFKKF